jgi:hypothetical protein
MKIVLKAGFISTNESEGKLERNSYAAFGTIFRLSNQFHRSQKLYDYFSLSQDIMKIHKQSVDVNKY